MLNDKDLRELLEYKSSSNVLSLYLNTDLTEGGIDTYKLNLRNMLKEVEAIEDVDTIERFIEHQFDWSGRSVAIFSCAADHWFRSYSLAVPIRSRLRISNRPFFKPLADLLDAYGGYGVAVVDKQGARFFDFHLGELREQVGIVGENIRRTKRGGGSQAPGRRGGMPGQGDYVDELAYRNAKEAAEFAARFFTEKNIRRVLIGGTEDNIAMFREQLPKSWQSLVVGTFPMSMTATNHEVLDRAMQVGQEANRQREMKLIDAVITSAAKGSNGVVGLDATLAAVREGRVHILLVQEGLREPGHQCKSCGYITAHEVAVCPYCGGEMERVSDAIEQAVRSVLQSGGEVEVLRDDMDLKNQGHIGGVLRY
jgi:peptide chain release factor subunit 1